MRIRLTTDRAGPFGEQHEGDVVDLPHAEALALIAARQAEAVRDEPECAVVGAPEATVLNRPAPRVARNRT